MKKKTLFEQSDIKAFKPEAKVGLVATVNPDGLPHITMISSIRAKSPTQLMWGQFCEGQSKINVTLNPKTGFLVMTPDRSLWRGKATWTHTQEKQGEDFEMYNNTPMFRYNAYFGIHTVHYMDLKETYGQEKLPLARVILSSILTSSVKGAAKTRIEEPILKPWGENLFNDKGALKFLAYVDEDGFPQIIPLLQCQAPDTRRLVFSPLSYGRELKNLKAGQKVAVFGLTMKMEDILVRGDFAGYGRFRTVLLGGVDLDWVYNSMPPKQGQIYPVRQLEPVLNF